MKNKLAKYLLYALNILFAVIIISPVVYCFNVSMMTMKEVFSGGFWPRQLIPDNYIKALQLAPFFYLYQKLPDRVRYSYLWADRHRSIGGLCIFHDEIPRPERPVLTDACNHDDSQPGYHHCKLPNHMRPGT